MTDVQFNEDAPRVSHPTSSGPRGMYKLVIQMGLAKDEKGAGRVLLVIAGLAILIGVVYPFLIL